MIACYIDDPAHHDVLSEISNFFQQKQAHITHCLFPGSFPAPARNYRRCLHGSFEVNKTSGPDAIPIADQLQRPGLQVKTKRRIHEGNVQRLSRERMHSLQSIGLHYRDLIRLEYQQDSAKISRDHAELLNQDDFRSAPRCSFQAEGPATGKQIHAHSAANMGLQPVKQSLAAAVT